MIIDNFHMDGEKSCNILTQVQTPAMKIIIYQHIKKLQCVLLISVCVCSWAAELNSPVLLLCKGV